MDESGVIVSNTSVDVEPPKMSPLPHEYQSMRSAMEKAWAEEEVFDFIFLYEVFFLKFLLVEKQ